MWPIHKNLFRAIENLGVELSYGIIFIGRGSLNIEDFARYVENHHVCDEYLVQVMMMIMMMMMMVMMMYLVQGTAYNPEVRRRIGEMRKSRQFLQYNERYRNMVESLTVIYSSFPQQSHNNL